MNRIAKEKVYKKGKKYKFHLDNKEKKQRKLIFTGEIKAITKIELKVNTIKNENIVLQRSNIIQAKEVEK